MLTKLLRDYEPSDGTRTFWGTIENTSGSPCTIGDLKWMSNMEARNTRWSAGPVTEPSQLSGILALVLGHLLGKLLGHILGKLLGHILGSWVTFAPWRQVSSAPLKTKMGVRFQTGRGVKLFISRMIIISLYMYTIESLSRYINTSIIWMMYSNS